MMSCSEENGRPGFHQKLIMARSELAKFSKIRLGGKNADASQATKGAKTFKL